MPAYFRPALYETLRVVTHQKDEMGHLLLSLLILSSFCHTWALRNLEELLPLDYDKANPPESEDGKPLQVKLLLRLLEVNHVNEDESELTMSLRIHIYWKEPRLLISPESEEMSLAISLKDHLWIPDLTVRNLKEMRRLQFTQSLEALQIHPNKTLYYVFDCELTIVCNMDFGLFPLDWQHCPVDFGSYKLPRRRLVFQWHNDGLLLGQLPDKLTDYEVNITKVKGEVVKKFFTTGKKTSNLRIEVLLYRKAQHHVLQTYIPSSLIIIISWISFVIPPKIVPGRMVLLVTSLLTLVTMYNNVRSNTPSAISIKCIEIWLIVCTFFIFCAILEYAILLFRVFHREKDPSSTAEASDPQICRRKICLLPTSLDILDRISLCLFPLAFIIFCCAYWGAFLGPVLASQQRQFHYDVAQD